MISTKSRIFLITVLITVLVLAVSGAAAAKTYHINELYIDINMPDDGIIITREMAEEVDLLEDSISIYDEIDKYSYIQDDNTTITPDMAEYDTIFKHIEKNLDRGRMDYFRYPLYLSYIDSQSEYEIDVKMQRTQFTADIFTFDIEEIDQQWWLDDNARSIRNDFLYDFTNLTFEDERAEGFSYDDMLTADPVYDMTINGINYFVFEYRQEIQGETIYSKAYYTIHNRDGIAIILSTPNSPIAKDLTAQLDEIVASVEFTETLEKDEDEDKYEGFWGKFWGLLGGIGITVGILWGIHDRTTNRLKEKRDIEKFLGERNKSND